MKTKILARLSLALSLNFFLLIAGTAQTHYATQPVNIQLNGTSNLHDWEMKGAGTSEATVVVSKEKITSLNKMSFSLPVIQLKSGHSGMDKNTYKALLSASHPNITFVLTASTIIATGNNNYKINCSGRMSVAGTTVQTDLVATGIYNPSDKSFTITGTKKMKMTDYNVKPPKALLGTIKTGNDISITYNVKFKV